MNVCDRRLNPNQFNAPYKPITSRLTLCILQIFTEIISLSPLHVTANMQNKTSPKLNSLIPHNAMISILFRIQL